MLFIIIIIIISQVQMQKQSCFVHTYQLGIYVSPTKVRLKFRMDQKTKMT